MTYINKNFFRSFVFTSNEKEVYKSEQQLSTPDHIVSARRKLLSNAIEILCHFNMFVKPLSQTGGHVAPKLISYAEFQKSVIRSFSLGKTSICTPAYDFEEASSGTLLT